MEIQELFDYLEEEIEPILKGEASQLFSERGVSDDRAWLGLTDNCSTLALPQTNPFGLSEEELAETRSTVLQSLKENATTFIGNCQSDNSALNPAGKQAYAPLLAALHIFSGMIDAYVAEQANPGAQAGASSPRPPSPR